MKRELKIYREISRVGNVISILVTVGAAVVPHRDSVRFFFAPIFDPISVEKRKMNDDNLFLFVTRHECIFNQSCAKNWK